MPRNNCIEKIKRKNGIFVLFILHIKDICQGSVYRLACIRNLEANTPGQADWFRKETKPLAAQKGTVDKPEINTRPSEGNRQLRVQYTKQDAKSFYRTPRSAKKSVKENAKKDNDRYHAAAKAGW